MAWPRASAIASVIVLAWPVAKRLPRPLVVLPFAVATLLAFGTSLAYSLWQTEANGAIAYFSTFTRVWQFAAGTLGALLVRQFDVAAVPWTIRATLAGIVISAVEFTDSTPYPGLAALLPTLSAATLISVGSLHGLHERARWLRPLDPSWWLSLRAPQFVGGLSYSWYLWHWPFIAFTMALVPDAGWPLLLAAAAVSGVVAVGSLIWLENPIRHSPTVRLHPVQGLSIGVTATMVALSTIVVVDTAVRRSIESVSAAELTSMSEMSGDDPFASDATSGAVTPNPVDAASDWPHIPAGCFQNVDDEPELGDCVLDPTTLERRSTATANRIVLFGDSHAAQWFPVVLAYGQYIGADVVVFTRGGCPAATFTVESRALGRANEACDEWRELALQHLETSAAPIAIFTSSLNRPDDGRLPECPRRRHAVSR